VSAGYTSNITHDGENDQAESFVLAFMESSVLMAEIKVEAVD
jgi:hypothetical protein